MAPGALIDTAPQTVTFHGGKGTLTRAILTGADMKPTFESIPFVDFKNARSDDFNKRKLVAREVYKAFTEVGFMYALNHGIDEDLQKRTTELMKRFFALPLEEKEKIHINNSPTIKGYEPLLETRLDESTRGDLKEAFQMGEDPSEPEQNPPADLDRSFFPPGPLNQWPESLPAFREVIYEYRKVVSDFSKTLLHMIAISLDLPEGYFDHMLDYPAANIRALFYPSQPAATNDTIGIGAHADYSWFTLVNQLTDTPALEVLNANGHWIPAPPVKASLVVNVGDVLERATNDKFVSTIHRVRNISGEERYSLAYFFSPSQSATITTLPGCVEEGRKPKYEDVNAGEWLRERTLRARIKHPAFLEARARGEV